MQSGNKEKNTQNTCIPQPHEIPEQPKKAQIFNHL